MIKLALRNCLRNKKRTIVTGLSVILAVFVVLLIMSFMYSCFDQLAENERKYTTGDIRIRNKKYNEFESLMPIQFYIENYSELKAELLNRSTIKSVESVLSLSSSLYRDGKLENMAIYGADIGSVYINEDTILYEGRFVENGAREVMATPIFLKQHSLSLGDSITCLFKTASGGTNAATFKIVGVVGYLNSEMNGNLLITTSDALAPLIRINDGALELHLWLNEGVDEESELTKLKELLSDRELDVQSWSEISWIAPVMPLYDIMIIIIDALFFFIASTLVFNTMMMSTLERKKELATMIAIGFSRRYIMILLVIEGLIISFIASTISAIGSIILIDIFGVVGIDLTGFGIEAVEGWGFPNILYTHLSAWIYPAVIIAEMAISAIATILATMRVRKLEVASSLREEA